MNELEFYKKLIELVHEGVYFVDLNRKIKFWNKGAELISGFTEEDMLGHYCYENSLNHVDCKGKGLCNENCPLLQTNWDGNERSKTVFLHHKKGHRVKVRINTTPIYSEGAIIGTVEHFTEIIESNLMVDIDNTGEMALETLALYDPLTRLPNRRYIEKFMAERHTEYKQFNISFAVIFIDIDNFREINNNYGHEIGDLVMKMIAKTYINTIGKVDLVGRWGGEEFVAVIPGVHKKQLAKLCEELRRLTELSILRHENREISITVSIGGTLFKDEDSLKTVLRRADELMYKSKLAGKNRISIG